SLGRLDPLAGRGLQRIGLSATQRPLDEVARYLGGAAVRVVPSGSGEPPSGGGAGGPPSGQSSLAGADADSSASAGVSDAGSASPAAGTTVDGGGPSSAHGLPPGAGARGL